MSYFQFKILLCNTIFVFFSEIGVGFAGFGVTFLFLGVLLLFDKGLLAIGNVSVLISINFIFYEIFFNGLVV